MANSGGVHDPQRAVTFRPSFLGGKRMVLGTAQRAIGLRVEVASGQAAHAGLLDHLWRSISRSRLGVDGVSILPGENTTIIILASVP